jgi:hypothetical protein
MTQQDEIRSPPIKPLAQLENDVIVFFWKIKFRVNYKPEETVITKNRKEFHAIYYLEKSHSSEKAK